MKKVSKLFALLLALIMVVGIAAGCGDNEGTSSVGSGTSSQANSGSSSEPEASTGDNSAKVQAYLDSYKEGTVVDWLTIMDQKYDSTVKLTTIRDTSNGFDDYSNNVYYKAYESILNIKVTNNSETTDYSNEVDALINSGKLPDFLRLSHKQFEVAYEAGLLQSLDKYYDAYATADLKKEVFSLNSSIEVSMKNDEVYGIASYYSTGQPIPVEYLYVRTDWREAAQIEQSELTTFDGFVKLAKAFKDAHGNGFTGNMTNQVESWSLYWMYNAHGAYKEIWVEAEDGSLVYSSIQPEMRTALEVMAKLYKDGLITITTDTGEVTWTQASESTLGIVSGKQWLPYSFPDSMGGATSTMMETYNVPAAEGVEKAMPQTFRVPQGVFAVSKDCQNPEAVIMLADLYVQKAWTDENFRNARYGAALMTSFNEFEHFWVGVQLNNYYMGSIDQSQMLQESLNCMGGAQATFGAAGSVPKFYAPAITAGEVIGSLWDGTSTLSYAANWPTLFAKENTVFTDIVTGKSDITAFDTFVTWWNDNGGAQITTEINAAR